MCNVHIHTGGMAQGIMCMCSPSYHFESYSLRCTYSIKFHQVSKEVGVIYWFVSAHPWLAILPGNAVWSCSIPGPTKLSLTLRWVPGNEGQQNNQQSTGNFSVCPHAVKFSLPVLNFTRISPFLLEVFIHTTPLPSPVVNSCLAPPLNPDSEAVSHSATLLPLSAISPTHAKCDSNNVKQLKQAVQVYKVKGIVQKRNKTCCAIPRGGCWSWGCWHQIKRCSKS